MIYNNDFHTYQFCNGTSWMSMSGGGPGSGPMTLISTQTANNTGPTLQWTSLPTSYNTLFMNCANLTESNSNGLLQVQVGEGAGPTWETGAHYTESDIYYGNTMSSNVPTAGTSNTASDLSAINQISTTQPTSFKFYIDNISSSTVYKKVILDYDAYVDIVTTDFRAIVGSYWNNDTNPVTALRVTVSTGNLKTGTCSLYGMN